MNDVHILTEIGMGNKHHVLGVFATDLLARNHVRGAEWRSEPPNGWYGTVDDWSGTPGSRVYLITAWAVEGGQP